MTNTVAQAGFAFVQDLAADLNKGNVKIPSFPDIIVRVRRALDDDDCDIEKLTRIASTEAALAARLLSMANSALLKRGGKQVSELRTAINRLGFKMVRNVAMSVAVEQLFLGSSLKGQRQRLRKVFHESTQMAATSFALAKTLTKLNPDEALMAGLLHNVGKLYILMYAADHEEFFDSEEALESVIENWHGQIGRAILEGWGFSTDMADAAADHMDLARTKMGPTDLTDVVTTAWVISTQAANEEFEFRSIRACTRLGLNDEKIAGIRQDTQHEIDALAAALRG
ncbi:MAG: HDOD domain-containing protein [Gammaproteobacteria bacterium]|nr:HDOD domain-containing protein [Gammaproteobacteria bacterium]MDH3768388.1 HDOD domain-containing protein [Gammaproteobacteria bacterium]